MEPDNKKSSTSPPEETAAPLNSYPVWSPRFWHGMRLGCWLKLLGHNRFRIARNRLHIAAGVSAISPINDILALLQAILLGRKIEKTEVAQPPIFILGHWRSGTTLLHELLVTNPSFASPSTFQCFAPSHFLLSESLMVRFGGFLLPSKRPMDNMAAGWNLPQEDEFALMNLGVPTPYLRIAFPETQDWNLDYLDFAKLESTDAQAWKKNLMWFIKSLTYRYAEKRLVMKSPPHTGRIAELAELFPNAKFIHLTRDPRKLFSSTMRLWRSLDEVQGLQPTLQPAQMQEYVFTCLEHMYTAFERGRQQVPARQLIDIRYEDLVAAPLETVRQLYETLELGEFEEAGPHLQEKLANHQEYRPNQHQLEAEVEQRILDRWSDYAKRYGYL